MKIAAHQQHNSITVSSKKAPAVQHKGIKKCHNRLPFFPPHTLSSKITKAEGVDTFISCQF